jgi:hypothetical protein
LRRGRRQRFEGIPRNGAGARAVDSGGGGVVMWSLLAGPSGCGPPGHSARGRIFSATPFVLPLLPAVALLSVSAKRRWRRSLVVQAVLSTVVTGGLLEVGVLLFEFGGHHCGK